MVGGEKSYCYLRLKKNCIRIYCRNSSENLHCILKATGKWSFFVFRKKFLSFLECHSISCWVKYKFLYLYYNMWYFSMLFQCTCNVSNMLSEKSFVSTSISISKTRNRVLIFHPHCYNVLLTTMITVVVFWNRDFLLLQGHFLELREKGLKRSNLRLWAYYESNAGALQSRNGTQILLFFCRGLLKVSYKG